MQRITLPEIIEDKWFQTDYEPAVHFECDEDTNLDDVNAALGSIEVTTLMSSKQHRKFHH